MLRKERFLPPQSSENDRGSLVLTRIKRLITASLLVATAFVLLLAARPVLAQSQAVQQAQQTAQAAGVAGGGDLIQIIGRLINIFLGLLGVVFLVLML